MNCDELDYVLFDAEHGVFDTQNVVELLQVCRLMGLPAFVRAQHNARCNTPLKERTKRFELSKTFKKQREEMLERIDTKQGILLRINRSIQVEGAFGVLKEDMGFRRFLTRGTANVRTEILILCLAYNIQKLHNKTVANRQGQFLHKIKAA